MCSTASCSRQDRQPTAVHVNVALSVHVLICPHSTWLEEAVANSHPAARAALPGFQRRVDRRQLPCQVRQLGHRDRHSQSTGGCIFGGFADASWTSSGDGCRAEEERRRLSCPVCIATAGWVRRRWSRRPATSRSARCSTGHAYIDGGQQGPAFGGGHDLVIVENANADTSSSYNVGNTYQCPAGQNLQTFLTGAHHF